MDDFTRVITLFKNSYLGKLSTSEQEELERVLRDKRLKEVYDELIRHDLLHEGIELEAYFPWRPALAKFKRRSGLWQRGRLVAASGVAACLVLGFSLYLLFAPTGNATPPREEAVIPPGHGQALVRLASGEVVALSDQPAEIAERGGTRLSYEKGKIAYTPGQDGEMVENELIVPTGGECCISFEDGTMAWVNADTRLTYPVKFNSRERVVIVEGEVYLEVAPDSRPFIVRARLGEVIATGTSFAVRAYDDERLSATLVSGKIRYAGFDREEVLSPGEQVIALSSGEVTRARVDIREHVGWKDGLFIFNRKPLEEIMTDLSRWYACSVSYGDERLRKLPFSGHLKRYEHINAFLELLRKTGEVDYVIRENHVTLY
ncbi:MAG: DUF4974 domain-containing protein [Odoribacteraceae bacterium]|jgi:ferric-dicitrate binding protein FerR (iron transport regulator)|nr:DUF4974 domain-containing protein [Odoribacteraceae bacterium]